MSIMALIESAFYVSNRTGKNVPGLAVEQADTLPDENGNEIGLMGGIKLMGETRDCRILPREEERDNRKRNGKRKAAEMGPKALL